MLSRADLSPKVASSLEARSVDFVDLVPAGDSISSQSVSVSVYSGTDASPSALLSGSASASGTIVTQKFTGGTEGVMYKVLWTAGTTGGLTLKKPTLLAIIPEGV